MDAVPPLSALGQGTLDLRVKPALLKTRRGPRTGAQAILMASQGHHAQPNDLKPRHQRGTKVKFPTSEVDDALLS
ncbi:MAG: hypothetical protein V1806_06460 [Pseudomonadota bacterium]